ncbi:MAG: peptidylprolyl isomerase [Patescibacteria group bacterium]
MKADKQKKDKPELRATILEEIGKYKFNNLFKAKNVKRFIWEDPKSSATETPVKPVPKSIVPAAKTPGRFLGQKILLLVLVLILMFLSFVFSFYRFRLDLKNPSLVNIFPWPVAYVDGRLLSIKDFTTDVETLKLFYLKEQQENNAESVFDRPSVERLVLEQMIHKEIVKNFTKRNQVMISNEVITAEVNSLIQEFGSKEELSSFLRENYNLDINQFQQKIIVPYLLRQQVTNWFTQNESANTTTREKAKQALTEITKGELSFAEAASKYSQDISNASAGGYLGVFSWGTMVPEFEDSLEQLEVGEVSEPVRTSFGWHLIKREEVPSAEQYNNQVAASHILFEIFNFDQWLEQERKQSKVFVFLHI